MTKDVLVVVALAADEERDRLMARLEGLGFRVECVGHAEWIKQPERPCLAEVLLLGESAPLARVHLMTPERRVPRLVLLGAGHVQSGGAVSALGDELAVWPCGDAELALRMDRLLQGPRGRAGGLVRSRQTDPFLSLNLVGAAPVFKPTKFLSAEAIGWMNRYRWPGKVRELENLIHRAFVLAETDAVDVSPNGQEAQERRRSMADRRYALAFDPGFGEAKAQYLEEFERRYLFWLMAQTDGNVTQAAQPSWKRAAGVGQAAEEAWLGRGSYFKLAQNAVRIDCC